MLDCSTTATDSPDERWKRHCQFQVARGKEPLLYLDYFKFYDNMPTLRDCGMRGVEEFTHRRQR